MFFGVSLVLCGVRLWTHSLAASTLIHATYNGTIFTILFVGASGSSSGPKSLVALAHRDALLKMLARLSFRLGEFKLSSGASSDYYIDCRTTTLTGEGGRLTGLAMLDLIRRHELRARAVGGLTLGADPGHCPQMWRQLALACSGDSPGLRSWMDFLDPENPGKSSRHRAAD